MTAAISLPLCETRIGKVDDLAYVVDSWTKNSRRCQRMPLGDATRIVRGILARETSRLLIAHVPSEPDAILGWAAVEVATTKHRACIHYVYVRKDARRQGVASRMLDGVRGRLDYSHVAPRYVVVPEAWTLNIGRADE